MWPFDGPDSSLVGNDVCNSAGLLSASSPVLSVAVSESDLSSVETVSDTIADPEDYYAFVASVVVCRTCMWEARTLFACPICMNKIDVPIQILSIQAFCVLLGVAYTLAYVWLGWVYPIHLPHRLNVYAYHLTFTVSLYFVPRYETGSCSVRDTKTYP